MAFSGVFLQGSGSGGFRMSRHLELLGFGGSEMHQAIKAAAYLAVASRGYFTGRGETARISKEDGQGSCSVDFTPSLQKSHEPRLFLTM